MVTIHLQSKSSSNPSKPNSLNRCSFYLLKGNIFYLHVQMYMYVFIYMELENRTKFAGETWALCPTVLITMLFYPSMPTVCPHYHTMPAHSDPLHREQEFFASSTVSPE